MNSIFVLIPVTLFLLLIAVVAWLWSVKNGQFDDLDREASRILFDDAADFDDSPASVDAAVAGNRLQRVSDNNKSLANDTLSDQPE